jgi:hypothetical protein
MNEPVLALLRHLAAVEPLDVPAGEAGVILRTGHGPARVCIPVLSVYLDVRPQAHGERPAAHVARMILRERLRQIEHTFWPRGAAFDAVHADGTRIEHELDTAVATATQGVAIFASAPHHLFETFQADVPFTSEVSAQAEPCLFQLAHLLDDLQMAVIAVVRTNRARLFITQRGGLREVRGLEDDPKYYHMVHGANAMNQAHYQRHAVHTRRHFADEVADRIAHLVDRERITQVILAGEAAAIALLREALRPGIARLVHEPALAIDVETSRDAVWDEIAPLLREDEAEQDRAVVDRLLEAVRAGGLGVAGLEPTRHALQRGQVDVLVLDRDVPFSPEARSELVELAARTDATIAIVEPNDAVRHLGGVGALLRYRAAAT